jgi:hypothetical protein
LRHLLQLPPEKEIGFSPRRKVSGLFYGAELCECPQMLWIALSLISLI